MAYIKTLKDNELIGGTDNTDVYPVSTTQAIFSQKPDGTVPEGIKHQRLEERLEDHEEDAAELHRKIETMEVSISSTKNGQDLEYDGEHTYSMTLTGSARLTTPGDEPAEPLSPNQQSAGKHMDSYEMKVSNSAGNFYPETSIADNNVVATFPFGLDKAPGTYVSTFTVTRDSGTRTIEKSASSSTYVTLRKYYGFSSVEPINITADDIFGVTPELQNSNISHSGAGVITVTAKPAGDLMKYIYIVIPKYQFGTKTNISVTQPDAWDNPFSTRKIGEINRSIDGTNYPYYLFVSGSTPTALDRLIESDKNKRLEIKLV